MAGSVAGNMAVGGLRALGRGERPRFRDLLLTPGNMRRIADDLARMRGAAMKLGQLISMDTGEVLPPELSEILARLRADADFMPPAQLKRVLNAAWGEGWLGQFRSFDTRPIAAASIGQVHRAKLRDGRDLAIKVQYPGIARSIDSDVSNLGALLSVSGLLPQDFEIKPYLAEARRQLHEEADFLREGACLAQFGDLLRDDPDFVVPERHEDWTTGTVLAMSFVASEPIEATLELPQEARDRIAELLIRLLLRELFEFGFMQTDPNFANYRYQPETDRILLLDFGATRSFGVEIVKQYRRLFSAGLTDDRQALEEIVEAIGFIAPDTLLRHRQAVIGMIRLVFQAISRDRVFDFGPQELSKDMNVAGEALAADGFLPPPVPMDALYLQRKFGGIFLLAHRLQARVAITDLIAEAISQPKAKSGF
ncbi:MAG: AarF/ABC1/UbiB kinase family protein [Pseudomonadota bacterium]